MALNLKKYLFCVTDYSFIYPKGTKEEDKSSTKPNYIKLNGFVVSEDSFKTACYIFEPFEEFGLTVPELTSYLRDGNAVLSGSGLLNQDRNFNHTLSLDKYNFKGKYSVTFDK